MPSHQYLAIVRDVNTLIDDFARAVLVEGVLARNLLKHL
jgi:hypothetical protein